MPDEPLLEEDDSIGRLTREVRLLELREIITDWQHVSLSSNRGNIRIS